MAWQQVLWLLMPLVSSQQLFDCPPLWETHGNRCYKFVFFPKESYHPAMQKCQFDGASLVSVSSRDENNYISAYLKTHDSMKSNWYTSGYQMANTPVRQGADRFTWQGDGTKVLAPTYWNTNGAGDDSSKTGHVIVYGYTGTTYGWTRTEPNKLLPYICEIDKAEAYRIIQNQRGFDYGVSVQDLNDINHGPRFMIEPNNTVILGKKVHTSLDCVVSANPPAVYTWRRGKNFNEVITAKTDVRYTLTNGRLMISAPNDRKDTGTYQCTAKNKYGMVLSQVVSLSFQDLREFVNVQYSPVNAVTGKGAAIQCPKITNKVAYITYQWMKTPSIYVYTDKTPHMFISKTGGLFFSETSQNDAGSYRCAVSLLDRSTFHDIGYDQTPSRVSTPIPLRVGAGGGGYATPEIVSEFIAVFPRKVIRGNTQRLECFAYGTLPLVYSWTRAGGYPIPRRAVISDFNRVLTIPNIQLEDGGDYTCTVYSQRTGNTDTKKLNLIVDAVPFFVFPLKDQHVDVGSQLTWRCKAIGVPEATYHWYKDGALLSEIPGQIDINQNVIIIYGITAQRDNGMYACGARNIYGTSFSNAQLRVVDFAPSFSKHPLISQIGATFHGNLTIMCKPEAAPLPTYEWSLNGNLLNVDSSSGSHTQMLPNGYLFIYDVQYTDAGEYTCKATNEHGSAQSSGLVEVFEATTISHVPTNTKVKVNDTAFLYCQASYNPILDVVYTWKLNDKLLVIGGSNSYDLGTSDSPGLYIRGAMFEHSGIYTCIVTTNVDQDQQSATLEVFGPPGEPAGVLSSTTDPSPDPNTIHLKWTTGSAHGSPIMYYIVEAETRFHPGIWKVAKLNIKDRDTIIPGKDKRSTFVDHLMPGNHYRLRMRAVNQFGVGKPSFPTRWLIIQGAAPLKAPAKVWGGGGSVGMLIMRWQLLALEDEGGAGISYIVHYKRKGTSDLDWIKKVVNGRKDRLAVQVGLDNYYLPYEVMVQAKNKYGDGNKNSTIAIVYSAEALITQAPGYINANSFNATAITVSWKMIPDDRFNMKGKLIGYKINYWRRDNTRTEDRAIVAIRKGQMSESNIIGLYADTYYYITVQAYNSAGNGPKSEIMTQTTTKLPPQLYPTEVHVHSDTADSVRVTFRGVSTNVNEEPVSGYAIMYWKSGEDFRVATHVDLNRREFGVIHGLEKNMVYKLRVYGTSLAGSGKRSSPETVFTLGGQVNIDPKVTDIMAAGHRLFSTWSVMIAIITALVMWSH